ALTAGLGCIPLAGTRVSTEHRLTVQVELYDVRAAPVRAVQLRETGEVVDEYDTSGLRPLLRRQVRVAMRSGVGLAGVGGSAALDFVDAQVHELVRRVLAVTEDGIAAAIRRAEATPPVALPRSAVIPPTPAAGEVLYTPDAVPPPGC